MGNGKCPVCKCEMQAYVIREENSDGIAISLECINWVCPYDKEQLAHLPYSQFKEEGETNG